jgi:TolB-like protein
MLPLRGWLWACIGALSIAGVGAAWQFHPPPQLRIDDELAARRAIAVLPLVDSDETSGVSALGNALADEISAQVSLRAAKRTVGRGTTARYDPVAPDAERIGRELNVRYVLSGRVVRTGDRIAVESNLISVATGETVRLNRSEFASASEALHANLGRLVASALRVQYYEVETARVTSGHPLDAADLTLLGWHDLQTYATRDDLLRGRARFEAALRVDAESVVATQGLGVSHALEFGSYFSPQPQRELEQCEHTLKRALEVGPNVPETLAAWGNYLVWKGQLQAAVEVEEKALEINPGFGTAHLMLALALAHQGRLAEAQQHVERARGEVRTERRYQKNLYDISVYVDTVQGRYREAYRTLDKWLAEYPTEGKPYLRLSIVDALSGDDAAAAVHVAKLREMLPRLTIAYLQLRERSDDPGYVAYRTRMIDGLRKAGLPEK